MRLPIGASNENSSPFLQRIKNRLPINAFVIGNGSKNAVERADTQCVVSGNGDTVRSRYLRLQNDVAPHLVDLDVSPLSAECGHQVMAVLGHAGVSSEGEHLIADEVKPKAGRLGPVEVECLNGLLDISPQLVPRVTLGKDAFG